MNLPLVSILIPAYNTELYIAETLDSALSQTWQNIEIIVVDDGSKDDSLAIAKQFESSIVKIISQQNQGASAARNRALREAQGDFIQYLDADDLLAPDKIERQLELIEFNRNSDYVVSGEWARFYKTPFEASFIAQTLWTDLSPIDWLVCAWKKNLMMHPAAWLVPRKIADLAGIWNENLSLNDDGEYFCRIILSSKGVKFCTGAESYYRSGNLTSLSALKSYEGFKSAFLSVELCSNHLLAKENSFYTRYAAACAWQNFVFTAYPQEKDLVKCAEKNIRLLGGCDLKPDGGFMFKIISAIFGWKNAKQLQALLFKKGHYKIALNRLFNSLTDDTWKEMKVK